MWNKVNLFAEFNLSLTWTISYTGHISYVNSHHFNSLNATKNKIFVIQVFLKFLNKNKKIYKDFILCRETALDWYFEFQSSFFMIGLQRQHHLKNYFIDHKYTGPFMIAIQNKVKHYKLTNKTKYARFFLRDFSIPKGILFNIFSYTGHFSDDTLKYF